MLHLLGRTGLCDFPPDDCWHSFRSHIDDVRVIASARIGQPGIAQGHHFLFANPFQRANSLSPHHLERIYFAAQPQELDEWIAAQLIFHYHKHSAIFSAQSAW